METGNRNTSTNNSIDMGYPSIIRDDGQNSEESSSLVWNMDTSLVWNMDRL